MDLIEAFKIIGLTKQETSLYLTLINHDELSGYEAAKLSGISRSNTYAALASLVEKGGANIVNGQTTKYIATPKKELLNNVKRHFNKVLQIIDEQVLDQPNLPEAFITITNRKHIFNKISNMLLSTEHHLYFQAEASILLEFQDMLIDLTEKHKVVLLTNKSITISNSIVYITEMTSFFKLIIDTQSILTGTLQQALYSKNKTLVHIIRESLMNEIKLIQMQRTNERSQ